MSKEVIVIDGISHAFLCPACGCLHQFHHPGWSFNGDTTKPTVSPSIRVRWGDSKGPHICHFFIQDGVIDFCSDCDHAMAGQKVHMIPVEDW